MEGGAGASSSNGGRRRLLPPETRGEGRVGVSGATMGRFNDGEVQRREEDL